MIEILQFVCHGDGRLTLHRNHAPLVNKQLCTTLNIGFYIASMPIVQFSCLVLLKSTTIQLLRNPNL
jgi:hypothetical protein